MAAINDLISKIQDTELRLRIQAEVNKLAKQKKFGLVFEDHVPECTALYDVQVRVGAKVALKDKQISTVYEVKSIADGRAVCFDQNEQITIELPVEELVVVAEFGEPIYPYLKPIDIVCNAPDSDLWHTLIEADNYHALQLLEYLYAGKVDCIYIDPPYNTGARDWKYNNDYVDASDAYRHSKWLSMMEKRLKLAKKLLNPKDSVLIVTIDEKEYLHLGCLLEELFSDATIQMVTIVNNPKGSTRGYFSRVDEYAFFVFMPGAYTQSARDSMLGEYTPQVKNIVPRWKGLLRSGSNSSTREENPRLFYPILIDEVQHKVVRANEYLPLEITPDLDQKIDGYSVAWPIRNDGSLGRWMLSSDTFNDLLSNGYISLGNFDKKRKTWGLTYLTSKFQKDIKDGKLKITGYSPNGQTVHVEYPGDVSTKKIKSVWHRTRHDAGAYGADLIKAILGEGRFTFPKSLYAVKDCLMSIVSNKPNALILDFFAGSGTTLHAVNLLNAEDGGQRRCIMVTNNEVSDAEAKRLKKEGCKPGDPEWESLGIAHHVTWPRTVCSIEGHDVNGAPLKGTYLESDRAMADGFPSNAAFFKLDFLDKNAVALGRQFKELLPVLWMKAGSHGPCPVLDSAELPSMLVRPENGFAVLVDEYRFSEFADAVNGLSEIDCVFIVTDSQSGFREMISQLHVASSYQLYRDYLDNFRINTGR